MGNPIVKIADFVGSVQIQQDDDTNGLFEAVRNEYADTFVRQMLGVELGNLFLADIGVNGLPVAARFLTIFNAIQEDFGGSIIESKGIKDMLKNIVFYYFARQNNTKITLSGNVTAVGENSKPTSDNFYLARFYNYGIDTAKTIQWYITQNLDVYPEYNGQEFRYNHGL